LDKCCTGVSANLTAASGGSRGPGQLRANLDTLVVTFAAMDGLTINEAARTTGWSPRMLRYVERTGLVSPGRSASGYRLYGPAELQRLRTLKELLASFDVSLADVAFAARMAASSELSESVRAWLEAEPRRPEHVTAEDWLRFEQEKHQRLLAAA
jgi:MerR family transcriptional regulator, copper efflux regulator